MFSSQFYPSFKTLHSILLYLVLLCIPSVSLEFPRLTKEQMHELVNPTRLWHRVFYKEPSRGVDAEWFDAIKQGDLKKIKAMVENHQNIEAKDDASLGQTALGWAAFLGYLDIVEYLIQKGANIYATDRADVKHAFKSAILGGDIKVIEYLYPLYKGKLDLNAQDKVDQETMLMVAAGNNREKAVKFLLDKKVNVNLISHYLRKTALTYACESKNPKIIQMIKDAGGINVRTGKPTCN